MSYWTICRMKTTKKIYVKVSIIFLLGGILLFSSCEKEENQKIEANRKTLFMYLPWSSNLTNYFYNNISDLEKCITKIGLNNEKVIVFISFSVPFFFRIEEKCLKSCVPSNEWAAVSIRRIFGSSAVCSGGRSNNESDNRSVNRPR